MKVDYLYVHVQVYNYPVVQYWCMFSSAYAHAQVMTQRYSCGPATARHQQHMKCPQCRHKTRHADVAYVMTRKSRDANRTLDDIDVSGDHSTKIQGVVACLLQIRRDDPSAKSLVFSTVRRSLFFSFIYSVDRLLLLHVLSFFFMPR